MEIRKKRPRRNQGPRRPGKGGRHTRVPAAVNHTRSIDYWVAATRAHST